MRTLWSFFQNMKNYRPVTFICLCIIFCMLILTSKVFGDDFTLTPSISLEQNFKDNILLNSSIGEKVNDAITTVSPSIQMHEQTDRLVLDVSGGLSRFLYRDYPVFDATDKSASSNLSYRLSQISDLSLSADYRDNSQPDQDIARTGLILGPSENIFSQYNFTWDQYLSEKTSWQMNLSRNEETYNNPKYIDNNTNSVNLTLSRNIEDLLENSSISIQGGFQRVVFSRSIEDNADTSSLFLGMQKNITQTISTQFSLGLQSSVSTFDTSFVPFLHERDNGMVGQFLIKEIGEYGESSLNISRNIGVNNESSGLLNRTSVVINVNRRFTEELSANLSCYFFLNKASKSEFSTTNFNEQTFCLNPSLIYKFNDSWQATAMYEYVLIRDIQNPTVIRGSTTSISISYSFKLME